MIPAIPEQPTAAQIGAAAMVLLEEMLGDFLFTSLSDRAHALAALLLPFMREMIFGATPLHLLEAPCPGTGKTLLAEMLLWPATGRALPTMTEGRDEDEWRKRITSKLLGGSSVVFLDNLRRRLDASAVASAITSAVWEDRILGRSEMQSIPVRCVWLASGNNPTLSLEMARRTVRIRIDSHLEKPWRRTGFRHPNLRDWVTEHRGRLIAAALTLGQAWITAGRPAGPTMLGMFEDWSRVMGGVLAIAGVESFLANLDDFYSDADTESAETRSFLAAWWQAHGDSHVAAADLLTIDPLPSRVGEGSDRGRGVRVGKFLRAIRDTEYQLADSLTVRVERAGSRQHAVAWRLRTRDVSR